MPELQYIEIDIGSLPHPYDFDRLVPVAPCAQCGRFTEDHTRNHLNGARLPEEDVHESLRVPTCEECGFRNLAEAFQVSVLETIDSKLGLSEKDRDALRAFIETIFTDPQKILQVKDLDNRVRSLETQVSVMWVIITGVIVVLAVAIVTAILGLG